MGDGERTGWQRVDHRGEVCDVLEAEVARIGQVDMRLGLPSIITVIPPRPSSSGTSSIRPSWFAGTPDGLGSGTVPVRVAASSLWQVS